MSSDEFAVELHDASAADAPIIRIRGEIDLRSSPELRATLSELVPNQPERLILDLSGVSYMDSSGVGTIVELKRRIDRAGGRVILFGLQPRVRSVFEITRLDKFFTITDGLEQARQA